MLLRVIVVTVCLSLLAPVSATTGHCIYLNVSPSLELLRVIVVTVCLSLLASVSATTGHCVLHIYILTSVRATACYSDGNVYLTAY